MCDASDFVVGAILGQRMDGKPFVYLISEQELLVMVFSLNKIHLYFLRFKTIVFIDHATVRYLMTTQDAKPRLIRWILFLQ